MIEKVCLISDLHGKWNKVKVPECDLLISTGDYSFHGEAHMVRDYHKWLNDQPARHIISGQGNHETWVEDNFDAAKLYATTHCPRVHFVEHELVEIEGLKIFYSAWTPWFYDWAYNAERTLSRAQEMQRPFIGDKWKDIPMDTDILATHGPAFGMLDQVYQIDGVTPRERVGCELLLQKILQLDNLKFHTCGHIHSGHGQYMFHGKKFYNASICGETYAADYEPILVEI